MTALAPAAADIYSFEFVLAKPALPLTTFMLRPTPTMLLLFVF